VNDDLFGNVTLIGTTLDLAVAVLTGRYMAGTAVAPFSTDWFAGGPLIESHQIFLDAPHETHLNFGPAKGGKWVKEPRWTATVSAAVRTKPNPNFSPDNILANGRGVVGRGAGPTPLIASMRAVVDSYVHEDGCKCGACPCLL
jgi:hypothetical protein